VKSVPYLFACECDGLVAAIRKAVDPGRRSVPDPSLGYMDLTDQAVWLTKVLARRARVFVDEADARKSEAA
jgi:hypothetical protein